MRGINRVLTTEIIEVGNVLYKPLVSILWGDGNVFAYISCISHSEYRDFLGDELTTAITKVLSNTPHNYIQRDILRGRVLDVYSRTYPGILNTLRRYCGCLSRNPSRACCATPLEEACRKGYHDQISLLLDAGANVSARASDWLAEYQAKYPRCDSGNRFDPVMKKLIRRGGRFESVQPLDKYALYTKQFESARDASLILIGIKKYKRSPLIPVDVPIDIIKVIAHQIRQRHEEIVIEVSLIKV